MLQSKYYYVIAIIVNVSVALVSHIGVRAYELVIIRS